MAGPDLIVRFQRQVQIKIELAPPRLGNQGLEIKAWKSRLGNQGSEMLGQHLLHPRVRPWRDIDRP
jgi:hypothetical protein